MSMTQEQQDNLKLKLVDTCIHLSKTKDDKKAHLAAFGEEIKGAEKRIEALSNAIKGDDITLLIEAFDEYEVDALLRGTR